MNSINTDALDQTTRTLIDLGLRYGPKILTAFIILVAGLFTARRVGQMLNRWLTTRELEPPVRMLIGRAVSLLVLLLFAMMALQNLGVELLPLFASLGVAGVGVGLAMQGVLSNLSAGLTIIFTKPFKVGEYVALVGVEGQVDSIELFSTTLLHADRSRVVIPNRKIVGEILHNYGKLRQVEIFVGVAYASDLDKALRVIRTVLDQNPHVHKELVPVVGVLSLDDSAIKIVVKPWVNIADYVGIGSEINRAIVTAFRECRIEIPFPQQEVRLLSAPPSNPV